MSEHDTDGTSMRFSVDLGRVRAVGNAMPGSLAALAAYDQHGLASHERLYHQLVGDLALVTAVFRPGDRIAVAGEDVVNAYIVRDGAMQAILDRRALRIGPGSVIGLAEGLANVGHGMTVVAETVVTTSVIPMHRALRALAGMHRGLRGITRNTVMRILQLPQVPETLK
jgi:CRP-like cAMP-binding protein